MLETIERKVEVKSETLSQRGLHSYLDSTLNLLNEPFRQVNTYDPISGETTYMGVLKHPFAGVHLADLIELVAPVKGFGGVGAIYADFSSAKEGSKKLAKKPTEHRREKNREAYLHHLHSKAPLIAEVYNDFMENHIDRWMNALIFVDRNYDRLFGDIHRISFINQEEYLAGFEEKTKQFVRRGSDYYQRGEGFELVYFDGYEENLRGYNLDRASIMEVVTKLPNNLFKSFLEEKTNIYSKESLNSKILMIDPFDLVVEERELLTRDFFDSLTPAQWERFIMDYSLRHARILIDLEKQKIFTENGFWHNVMLGRNELQFTGRGSVFISRGKDAQIEIVLGELVAAGKYEPRIINYKQVPKSTYKDGLYPLIAIRQDKLGRRRFLSQEEANWHVGMLGMDNPKQLDAVLGKVLLAYLSPAIIANWPKEMSIGIKKQMMMGAQTPVLAGLPLQSQELLSDDNPAVAKLVS